MKNVTKIHLIRRPSGKPSPNDFKSVTVDLPDIKDGQILVENLYMSVDPYMRRSMDPVATDLPPWPLNSALDGPSIGRVVESKNPAFAVGDIVESMSGWQSHFISDGDEFVAYISANTAIAKREVGKGIKPEDYLGLLGVAAQTGYFGMMCAAPKLVSGETLVVSGGAGVVGSVGCQIGKMHGMRVVSSAGSDAKINWLKQEAKVDYAFNYKTADMASELKKGCPNGIDLVLECASPEHMSACFPLMNECKTVLIAGMISTYNARGHVENINNFEYVLDNFLTLKSYPFMNYLCNYDQFVSDMTFWRNSGKLIFKQKIYDGLENATAAFCGLFTGESHGKSLVKIAD